MPDVTVLLLSRIGRITQPGDNHIQYLARIHDIGPTHRGFIGLIKMHNVAVLPNSIKQRGLVSRYFKDLNSNRKLDSNESLSGDMIHTTPDNEAQYSLGQTVTLMKSHGCIHIRPQDRNTLNAMGIFKPGTSFTVHKYDERP